MVSGPSPASTVDDSRRLDLLLARTAQRQAATSMTSPGEEARQGFEDARRWSGNRLDTVVGHDENYKANADSREILLMPKTSVSGDENIESAGASTQ
jgi:hypothetical protein